MKLFGLEVTGSLNATGNISGSATSTGSFGYIKMHKVGYNGEYFKAGESAGRELIISAAQTTNVGDTHVFNARSTTGVLKFQTTNTDRLTITGNKISGSSVSTGSFGRIQVAQQHYLEFLEGGVGTAPKWQIFNNASNVFEITSNAYGGSPITIDATGGGVNVAANLDVGAGIDVTGDGNFSGNVIVDTGGVYSRQAAGTLNGAGGNLGGAINLSLGSQTANNGTRIKMDSGNSTGEFIMQARGSSGYSDGQIEFFRRSASTVFDHLLTISGDGKQISGSQYSTGSFGRIEANVAGIHITTSSMAIDNDLVGGGNLTYGNVTTDRHEFTGSLNVSGSGIEIDGGLGINTPVDAQITTKTKVDGSNAIVALDHDGNTMMRLRDSAGAALFNLYDGGVESITLDADANGGGIISGSARSTGSFGQLALASFTSGSAHGVTGLTNHGLPFYEEGEFTVTVAGDGSGAFSAEAGEFTRVGRAVHFRIGFDVSANFAANTIGGLPYNATGNSASPTSVGPTGVAITNNASDEPITFAVNALSATIGFYSGTDANDQHLPNTTNNVYRLSGTYFI